MFERIRIERPDHTDLNMYQCGMEDCNCSHFWGPGVRDHYLIHYILNGRGIFQARGKSYLLGEGDGFLISPGEISYYKADDRNPWTYYWVGFHGIKAESYLSQACISADNPVFQCGIDSSLKDTFFQMLDTKKLNKSREVRLLGLLYTLLSQLIEQLGDADPFQRDNGRKELYVKKAIDYISMNYSRRVSINDLTSYIGINRSYLCSLFKQITGLSPREYLIRYRIERACELMPQSSLSISDISRSAGYEDPLLFSKIFKKLKGTSPREYRKLPPSCSKISSSH